MRPSYHLPKGGTQTGSGIWLGRVAALMFGTIAPIWAATEYIAWCFLWNPHLGFCWFGYVYYPWAILPWWWFNRNVSGTDDWWRHALWIIALAHLAEVVAIYLVIRRSRQFGGKSDLHGSAQWATDREVKKSGLLQQKEGVYVGGWNDGKRLHYLRHNGPQHILAFAPTRGGKGISLVIPTLLSYSHSAVVTDIKGENWALTAGWRKKEANSTVLRFDPTCTDGSAAQYNPLLEIRPSPLDVRDAQNIATLLIDPDGETKWDHWDRTAYDLITGVILHQVYVSRDKSLAGCFHLLTDPAQSIEKILGKMLKTVHDPQGQYGWIDPETGQPTKTHSVVAGAARAVLNKSENERSSVISSAISFFDLYRDPIVAKNTQTCDFSLRDLMQREQPVSLYLTTPPSDLARTRPLFRLLIAQLGYRLTEEMQGAVDNYRKGRRLLFMVDEFASLGKLEFFNTTLAYSASYGIQCYLILQDLSQLDRVYGKDSSIVANCHVRVAFTPNTLDTARTMSDMLGTMTVMKDAQTYTGSRFSLLLRNVISSEQETQRPLMTADELLQMPESDAVVFTGGQRPIYGAKIPYYRDAEFLRRSQFPAPIQSDRLPFISPWTYVERQEAEKKAVAVKTREVSPLEQEMEGLL